MLVINCSSKLLALGTQLAKHFPESLTVYGALKTIIQGNPFRDEVVVDSWPDFRAVITRPQKKYLLDPFNDYRNAYSVFYRDLGAYRDLLEGIGAINSAHSFHFHGHQEGVCETSLALAEERGVNVRIIQYVTVRHLDPMGLQDITVKPGQNLTWSTVEERHVDLLNKLWSYGGTEKCRLYLKDLVRLLPNCCLLDEESNLISWALTNQFGTLSHGFTMPGHRQKGYSNLVISTLARKLHSLGFPVLANVLQDNIPSKEMLKNMGFTFFPCPFFRVFHTPKLSTIHVQE